MSPKSAVQQRTQDSSRIPFLFDVVSREIKRVGIKLTLKNPDPEKLKPLMEKSKKPAEFNFSLDGSKFSVDVRVGSSVTLLGQTDLASESDIAKRREILQTLMDRYELATKADLEKFAKEHPDPKELDSLKTEIRNLERDLGGDNADRKSIQAYSDYDSGERAAGYDVRALMKEWTKDKHSSWTHYIQFIEDIDAGKEPKLIFDTYLKEGASLPVNLPEKLLDPIEHDLANGKVPNFKSGRTLIAEMIKKKFIPQFKKERLALYDKLIRENAAKLADLRKKYAQKGGK